MVTKPKGGSLIVEANGIRLHCLKYGDTGSPIVVFPGITSPAITWEFVAEPLSNNHTIYVSDMRGRGQSDHPDTGYALKDYSQDAMGLVECLELTRPIMLGHSMGARALMDFGARYPDVAGGLIIVDPPLTGPGRAPFGTPLSDYVDALHRAQRGATTDDMRAYFPNWPERELRLRAEWLPSCDKGAIVESYDNLSKEDVFQPWSRVKEPALFIYGDASGALSRDGVEELRALNPDASYVGIPGAGHMVPWDALEVFVATVEEFVRGLAR